MTDQEFWNTFSIQLNLQQKTAVRQTEGPVLLLAVPGSGKTTVLVARLGYLLYCKGVSPKQMLTVTYTASAAGDMKRRFQSLFGEKYAGQMTFRTINSMCSSIIRFYAHQKGSIPFSLADNESQINSVLRELLARTGTVYPSEQMIKDARTHITYCKNMMFTEAEVHAHKMEGMDFPAVYFEYQDYLRRSRLMDFDDQMVFALRILRREPDILAYYQRRYRYLSLDEAQDTSKIQHAILALLAQKNRNYFVVGDEDQSIYGFRAAWPQALLRFERDWPGAKVLLMEMNYRSTKSIVERADIFIQRNQDRHPKHIRTENPQGEPIRKIELADYSRQASYLFQVARDCRRSTAVLYRNNDSVLPLLDLLEREGVPYACRQRESFFFTSPVVRDLTDILSFAFNDCDRETFLRFYYKLDLKLKKGLLTDLLRFQRENESVFETLLNTDALESWQTSRIKAIQTHFAKLPQLTSFAALQRIVKYMGYGAYMKEQKLDASKIDILLSLANQTTEVGAFLPRLRALREVVEEGGREDCPFVLSTIHASKGLEYDRVILLDVVDGGFPSVRVSEALSLEDRVTLEEERRLFYVGVTRAKERLELLTYREKFGEPREAEISFVQQLLGEEAASQPEPEVQHKRPKPVVSSMAGPVAAWEKNYLPGVEVVHKKFGWGLLRDRTGSIATISFREAGVKRLDLAVCLKRRQLELAHYLPDGE